MAEEIAKRALGEGRTRLSLAESLELVRLAGLPVARYEVVKAEGELEEAFKRVGAPVALKVSSPDIIHKTEVGGVVLGIESVEELRRGYRELMARVRKLAPEALVDGVVVQEMVGGGYEVIIGGLYDKQFGPVVMFGLGGIFVEVFRDVSFELAPVDMQEALDMVKSVRGYKILSGYRGQPPADLEALANAICAASKLLWELRDYIAELDLNPVFAMPSGVKVVDARVILRADALASKGAVG